MRLQQSSSRDAVIGVLFVIAMWLTRSHEIVSVLKFPDVTLAAFFLAGIFTRRSFTPALLLINAALIDYVAIVHGGVSDYCVTPAYVFLIPTYLTLWGCGRWVQLQPVGTWRSLMRSAIALSLGVLGAFFISNASFYAFSGYFREMSALTYATSVVRYLPGYFEGTLIYAGVVLGSVAAWRGARELRTIRAESRK
jgi:hypothetical protein